MDNIKKLKMSKKYINIAMVSIALFASCFTVYAIYHLLLNVSLKFGFTPNGLDGKSSEVLLSLFMFFLVLSLFPFFLFVGWMSLFKPKHETPKKLPFVSIIIPAFNEQETVGKSIECALKQDYPNFEVLVVDDGSSDFTPLLIDHPEVRSIHLARNQGKANTVNKAIEEAKGEFLLFSDSDSHLHPDAIKHLITNFTDPKIGVISGQLIVRKKTGLVVLWQTIEYIFSQAIVKIAQCGSGASISVCPGPICMYRRKLMLSLGGFKDRTLVEDFDMTLEVVKSGNKAIYEPRAIAWTSTPETFKALKSQRVRWYRGNLQALKIYKDMIFNGDYGVLGLFWFPYLLFWGFGGAILQLAILFSFPIMILFSDEPFEISLFGFFLYLIFELISAAQYMFVLALDRNFRLSLVLAAFVMKPYHVFLATMHIISIYREIKKEKITWNG